MSTSFGWEGKGRYGMGMVHSVSTVALQMNAGCAGKTEIA